MNSCPVVSPISYHAAIGGASCAAASPNATAVCDDMWRGRETVRARKAPGHELLGDRTPVQCHDVVHPPHPCVDHEPGLLVDLDTTGHEFIYR